MTAKCCAILGCTKPAICKSMCHMHYRRHRLGKDLLAPQQISSPGIPRDWMLNHVNYTGEGCLIWPFARGSNGYGKISRLEDSYRTTGAHKEMCRLVHGDPPTPKHHAAHSCGKGHLGCVHPKHVSWKTPLQNSADREVHGTVNRGARNGSVKLTEDQVHAIRAIYDARGPRSKRTEEIGAEFGVSRSVVSSIGHRHTWGWLP